MIYTLKCGACGNANNVEASDPIIAWACKNCGNESATSLPTKPDGTLVTDHTKASSILSPTDASSAKNVVTAEKIDTATGTKAVVIREGSK